MTISLSLYVFTNGTRKDDELDAQGMRQPWVANRNTGSRSVLDVAAASTTRPE